jgi:long-chain acyl-CoA synthetase
MIIRKILDNCNEHGSKVALSYLGKELTYDHLKLAIIDKQKDIVKGEVIIIPNVEPIETLIHFLAAALNNQKSLVVPKDWKADKSFLLNECLELDAFEIGILSSGSTGLPKVIWKTNDNWEKAFQHQSDIFGIGKEDKVFVLDALSYSANLNSAIHALWCGATLVFGSLKNASNWQHVFRIQNVTSIFLVPSHWNLIIEASQTFEKVNSCVSAGEKLNGKQAKAILRIFPKATLTEYYGVAELGHIAYHQGNELVNSPQSVGKVFPEVGLKIIDQRIHVISPYIAPEYKLKGTVGDMGYLENERLVLLGRAGRMFNKRGINVFAQEIEQVVLLHPLVKSAFLHSVNVLSIPKLQLIYEAKSPQETLDESEIWDLLNQKIEKAKHPHFLKRVAKIPVNYNGKIAIGQLSKKLDEEAVVYMN